MKRGVAQSLVGSVVLAVLAGCGRSWVETRAPWRHDAEVECLKSGAVREGPGITTLRPIDGPGICGADFPLKVAVLGASQALGFADDPRPPGAVPQYSPARVPANPIPAYPAQAPYPAPSYPDTGPLQLGPPGGDLQGDMVEPSPVPPTYGASPQPLQPEPPAPDMADPRLAPASPATAATPATVTPTATLACPVISRLDTWITQGVQPAALRWFGQPVVEIKQISAYSCRPMNGQRGNPISEHAFGNALDVAAFTLADGHKITVRDGWHGSPVERAFLHDVQGSACQLFTTVLAPGSNVFHYDHIHVDLARHASGRSICKPAPISGELIARGDSGPTGTLGSRQRPGGARAGSRWDDEYRSQGGPGED